MSPYNLRFFVLNFELFKVNSVSKLYLNRKNNEFKKRKLIVYFYGAFCANFFKNFAFVGIKFVKSFITKIRIL